jgi:replicative DNA helicase
MNGESIPLNEESKPRGVPSTVNNLPAADAYAKKGYAVFPLYSMRNGRCSCEDDECNVPENKSRGKHPRTQHGFKDATTDPATITKRWTDSPDSNVGIRTGEVSGLVIVDVDPGKGGDVEIVNLQAKYGELPPTFTVITGSGGKHLYYAHPGGGRVLKNQTDLLGFLGVDIRADGGYVVAPPSNHFSGQHYEVEQDVPLHPCPEWLVEKLTKKPAETSAPSFTPVAYGDVEVEIREVEDWIRRPKVPRSIQGQNGSGALMWAVGKICATGRKYGFGEAQIWSLVCQYNAEKSEPPWSDHELERAMSNAQKERRSEPLTLRRSRRNAFGTPSVDHASYANGRNGHTSGSSVSGDRGESQKSNTDDQRERGDGVGSEDSAPAEASPHQPKWEQPAPLGTADLPKFPVDVLPRTLRDYVLESAEEIQVAVDMVAVPLLSVIATCVQGRYVVCVAGNYVEPLSLFTLCFAESGERKSAALASATEPLREWEAAERIRLRDSIERDRAKRAIKEKRKQRLTEDAAKEKDLAKAVGMTNEAIKLATELANESSPNYPCAFHGDVTPERLARDMAEQGERGAVFSAEAGVFGNMSGRYSGMPNLDLYLQGHASDFVRVHRQAAEPIVMQRPTLTMALLVQPEVVRGLSDGPGFRGRGLLARFLYSRPESLVGRRSARGRPVTKETKATYRDLILRLLQGWTTPAQEPTLIRLSVEASAVHAEFAKRFELRLGPAGDLHHIADWGSKATGAAARLAGLLHVAKCAEANRSPDGEIPKTTMSAAIKLTEKYLVDHALAAFGAMGTDPRLLAARELLAFLLARNLERFSLRELHQLLKGRAAFQLVEAVRSAVLLLEEHGYVAPSPPPIGDQSAGRPPSPVYLVNPLARKGQTPPQNPQNADTESNGLNSEDCERVFATAAPPGGEVALACAPGGACNDDVGTEVL